MRQLDAGYLSADWKAVHPLLKSFSGTLRRHSLGDNVLKAKQIWKTSNVQVHISTLKGPKEWQCYYYVIMQIFWTKQRLWKFCILLMRREWVEERSSVGRTHNMSVWHQSLVITVEANWPVSQSTSDFWFQNWTWGKQWSQDNWK